MHLYMEICVSYLVTVFRLTCSWFSMGGRMFWSLQSYELWQTPLANLPKVLSVALEFLSATTPSPGPLVVPENWFRPICRSWWRDIGAFKQENISNKLQICLNWHTCSPMNKDSALAKPSPVYIYEMQCHHLLCSEVLSSSSQFIWFSPIYVDLSWKTRFKITHDAIWFWTSHWGFLSVQDRDKRWGRKTMSSLVQSLCMRGSGCMSGVPDQH